MAVANVAVMIWVWILAVLMVVLVGAAVLPRRASQPREGFPWFWLSFPTATFLVAGSLHVWLPAFDEPGDWWRYMPLTNRQAVIGVAGPEYYWPMQARSVAAWILPILSLSAVGLRYGGGSAAECESTALTYRGIGLGLYAPLITRVSSESTRDATRARKGRVRETCNSAPLACHDHYLSAPRTCRL